MQGLEHGLVVRLVDYNPVTGLFVWNHRPRDLFKTLNAFASWNTRYAGKLCFNSIDADGCYRGMIFKRTIKAHRLAWFIMTGEWPEIIDHDNGCRTDNRFINLKSVDVTQNARNLGLAVNNTSTVTGVNFVRSNRKWNARIRHNGERLNLGYFDDFQDAVRARKCAEQQYGYHVNHGVRRQR